MPPLLPPHAPRCQWMLLVPPGLKTRKKPAFPLALGLSGMLLSIVLVELSGIEPLTSSLRTRRSPS